MNANIEKSESEKLSGWKPDKHNNAKSIGQKIISALNKPENIDDSTWAGKLLNIQNIVTALANNKLFELLNNTSLLEKISYQKQQISLDASMTEEQVRNNSEMVSTANQLSQNVEGLIDDAVSNMDTKVKSEIDAILDEALAKAQEEVEKLGNSEDLSKSRDYDLNLKEGTLEATRRHGGVYKVEVGNDATQASYLRTDGSMLNAEYQNGNFTGVLNNTNGSETMLQADEDNAKIVHTGTNGGTTTITGDYGNTIGGSVKYTNKDGNQTSVWGGEDSAGFERVKQNGTALRMSTEFDDEHRRADIGIDRNGHGVKISAETDGNTYKGKITHGTQNRDTTVGVTVGDGEYQANLGIASDGGSTDIQAGFNNNDGTYTLDVDRNTASGREIKTGINVGDNGGQGNLKITNAKGNTTDIQAEFNSDDSSYSVDVARNTASGSEVKTGINIEGDGTYGGNAGVTTSSGFNINGDFNIGGDGAYEVNTDLTTASGFNVNGGFNVEEDGTYGGNAGVTTTGGLVTNADFKVGGDGAYEVNTDLTTARGLKVDGGFSLNGADGYKVNSGFTTVKGNNTSFEFEKGSDDTHAKITHGNASGSSTSVELEKNSDKTSAKITHGKEGGDSTALNVTLADESVTIGLNQTNSDGSEFGLDIGAGDELTADLSRTTIDGKKITGGVAFGDEVSFNAGFDNGKTEAHGSIGSDGAISGGTKFKTAKGRTIEADAKFNPSNEHEVSVEGTYTTAKGNNFHGKYSSEEGVEGSANFGTKNGDRYNLSGKYSSKDDYEGKFQYNGHNGHEVRLGYDSQKGFTGGATLPINGGALKLDGNMDPQNNEWGGSIKYAMNNGAAINGSVGSDGFSVGTEFKTKKGTVSAEVGRENGNIYGTGKFKIKKGPDISMRVAKSGVEIGTSIPIADKFIKKITKG